MALGAAVARIASTVVSTFGVIQKSQQDARAYKDASRMQKYNAMLEQNQALEEAQKLRQEGYRHRSALVASAGAAGVDVNSGSVLSLITASSQAFESDAAAIIRTGNLNAAASRMYADRYSSASKSAGSSWLNVGASLFSGGKNIYSAGQKANWWE